MRKHRALGATGGAGSEDYDGRILGSDRGPGAVQTRVAHAAPGGDEIVEPPRTRNLLTENDNLFNARMCIRKRRELSSISATINLVESEHDLRLRLTNNMMQLR